MNRKLLILIIFFCGFINSKAQTFDCFITNDYFLSPQQYQFEIYIAPTSSDFFFRTIQMGFTVNPMFIDPAANITVSPVAGSTELLSYTLGSIQWNSSVSCISIPSSAPSTCIGGPSPGNNTFLTVGSPKRVSAFVINSDRPFNCAHPNLSMIRLTDPAPAAGVLKMAVSMWSNTCVATTITANGTYSHFPSNTLYNTVNNPLDSNCNTNVQELENNFSIYPNPTSDKINIVTTQNLEGQIRLYNFTGALVYESYNYSHLTEANIDISTLPSGMYVLKIANARSRIVVKE